MKNTTIKEKVDKMREDIFSPSWKWEVYRLALAAWFALSIIEMQNDNAPDGKYSITSDYDSCANYKTLYVVFKDGEVDLIKAYDVVRRGALGLFSSRFPFEDDLFASIRSLIVGDYKQAVKDICSIWTPKPRVYEAIAEAFA